MKPRQHDPRRLNVESFATDAGALEGKWALPELTRLAEVVPEDAPADLRPVHWSARGERRRPKAIDPETWLHLDAQARVWMTCQRCLQPLAVDLEVDRSLRFVASEAEAERLDAESEDDVLALETALDLQALVEDELLLALPLVPRHADCEPAVPLEAPDELDAAAPAEHPFAKLATLKRSRTQ
jgi:uncharacterized protein